MYDHVLCGRIHVCCVARYMADVVARAHKSQRTALRETVVSVLKDLQCAPEDHSTVLHLADSNTAATDNSIAVTDDQAGGGADGAHAGPTVDTTRTLSSVEELRDVVRRLGTKHRDRIYLKRMEGVGRETGFGQLLETADRVQTAAAKGMDGTILRQASVPEWGAVPWAERVMFLLDSACGVRDRYGDFMTMLAEKAGAEYVAAPLKGLRLTHSHIHSLTHSLTPLLTHTHIDSHTHSFTHSLTHFHTRSKGWDESLKSCGFDPRPNLVRRRPSFPEVTVPTSSTWCAACWRAPR